MPDIRGPALDYALKFGWPVLLIKPRSKEPYTAHGVKDATTDERTILAWLERYPDANLAVACGAPGPDVLDIDDPKLAGGVLPAVQLLHPPVSATFRGSQMFFAGSDGRTISLPYGELRRRGSYVVVPPSVHPSGKEYVWLEGPRKRLPQIPDVVVAGQRSAGAGEFTAPPLIPHSKRHDALKDLAVRLVRSGITDVPTLEKLLREFYEERCVKTPAARKNEFIDIARWATSTDIARRERLTEDNSPMPAKKKPRGKPKLKKPPADDAALAEHREYVKLAAGLPDAVEVASVIRYGLHGLDALEIHLSNGQRIVFDEQRHVTTRGWWVRTVIACTSGISTPVTPTDGEMPWVFRSLCILADTPEEALEAEDLRGAVDELLASADPITDYDLSTSAERYRATIDLRARPVWDPLKDHDPTVLVDRAGRRHLRSGELRRWLTHQGFQLSSGAVKGRMKMIGLEYLPINGRSDVAALGGKRPTAHTVLFRLPEEW